MMQMSEKGVIVHRAPVRSVARLNVCLSPGAPGSPPCQEANKPPQVTANSELGEHCMPSSPDTFPPAFIHFLMTLLDVKSHKLASTLKSCSTGAGVPLSGFCGTAVEREQTANTSKTDQTWMRRKS